MHTIGNGIAIAAICAGLATCSWVEKHHEHKKMVFQAEQGVSHETKTR